MIAFALAGREDIALGVALGYVLVGLSARKLPL